jgi:ubiquinone/menaquinone biosynthesis C-methylase UbiE
MDYAEALRRFGECYKDRYSVEFPLMLELCSFEGKNILEIGAGREGYFPSQVLEKVKRYVATDISEDILDELAGHVNVDTGVCRAESLPFGDRSFDIVLSRWVTQGVDLEAATREMCRVAGEAVMIVLPSEEGDETDMLRIKFQGKREERRDRVLGIKKWISESGLRASEERRMLRFLLPDPGEAADIMSALAFGNDLNGEEKQKLMEFFKRKMTREGIWFRQGACFILGRRQRAYQQASPSLSRTPRNPRPSSSRTPVPLCAS